jgi:hypothetical protein
VCFSIQRLIVVYFPFKKHEFCSKSKTRLIIFSIIIFGGLFYSFSLVSTGINKNSCVVIEEWYSFAKVFMLIDAIQSIFLPFIIILLSNTLIMVKLMKKFNSKNQQRSESFKMLESNKSLDENINHKHQNISQISQKHNQKSNKDTTKTLLLIAITFLILNFPIACLKTYNYIFYNNDLLLNNFTFYDNTTNILSDYHNSFNISLTEYIFTLEQMVDSTNTKQIIEKLASFIYYVNFSINFFLYTLKTRQFREKFFGYFRIDSCKYSQRTQEYFLI